MSDCMSPVCGMGDELCSSCAKDKRIAELEKENSQVYTQALGSELETKITELQAKLDFVLAELTVLVDWIGRGFSAADAATEITAIIEREKALREQK